ncbi:MAG: aldehyde dehydrogenase family protein [Deltaproteobacteria bacterium]|nr:aldehyde dehydrogenase family protein [Deltaproteobacteria bacterium]
MIERTIKSHNPATGEYLGEVHVDEPERVKEIVALSRKAAREWGRRTFLERGDSLLGLQQVIVRRADEIAEVISSETGKPRIEAMAAEIAPVVYALRYWRKRAAKVLKPKTIPLRFLVYKKSYLTFYPLGVVGLIAPWNYPFAIPMGDMTMALIAGNSILLKPSEQTPLVGKLIASLFKEADFPEGVVSVLFGGGDTGAALIGAGVDKIVFTGGGSTGRRVMAMAAETLTPVTLELGGKDPMIICEDADLELAVEGALWGGMSNAGQTCAGVKRIYIARKIAEPFIEALVKRAERLRLGVPADDHVVDVGAIVLERQIDLYRSQLADAEAQGAKILCGGREWSAYHKGRFFAPTVVVHVQGNMRLVREETFGPILAVDEVDSVEEAIDKANDSELGLCASVWSRDINRAKRIAERLEAGTVVINDCTFTHALVETPWGGVKKSGFGRVHSDEGLKEFVNWRHINYNRGGRAGNTLWGRAFWWFPYSPAKYRLFRALTDWLGTYGWWSRGRAFLAMVKAFWKMKRIH